MELRARTLHLARPAALSAACAALLALVAGPATADAKATRYPVVTSISPLDAKVGDTISIRGRNFRRGKNKNTVVFKRDGARAVFAKQTLGTAKLIRVVVPDTLRPFLTEGQAARVRVRVLSERFSKAFTPAAKSPMITAFPKPVTDTGTGTATSNDTGTSTAPGTSTGTGTAAPDPGTPAPPAPPAPVCTGDEDGDMLTASLENSLGLDACKADTDGDGVTDGYEYQSARDLNDDEHQESNTNLPYPGKRPYPNPLFADSDVDYDGDGLPQLSEFRLWDAYGARPAGSLPDDGFRLLYSDGEQYSLSAREGGTGRRTPTQPAAGYDKMTAFLSWVNSHGYNPVFLSKAAPWYDAANRESFDIRDVDNDHVLDASEATIYDRDGDGYISDDERDEDADGLTNVDELRGRMTAGFWKSCYEKEQPYKTEYAGTDLVDRDTDGDGVVDGADDQDHDDIPNLMELSRYAASGLVDWDAHDGQCKISSAIPETVPDGPDSNTEPDPLEDWHPNAYGRVNPFNPCMPYDWSRTCPAGVTFGDEFAPFDGSTSWFSLQ